MEPLAGMLPDQPPEAVHEVPAGAVQVRVAPPPFDTAEGVALSETAEAEPSEPSLPPHALRIDRAKKTSGPRSTIIRPRECSSNAPLLDKLINVPLTIYAEDNISSGGDMIGELESDANVSQFTYGTRVLVSLAYVRWRNVQEKKLRDKSVFALGRSRERSAFLFFREDGCAREVESASESERLSREPRGRAGARAFRALRNSVAAAAAKSASPVVGAGAPLYTEKRGIQAKRSYLVAEVGCVY
jgi:hypothetical protein